MAFTPLQKFDPPAGSDTVTVEYSGNIEVYKYRIGGETGSVVRTVTITYDNPSKDNVLSVVVTE